MSYLYLMRHAKAEPVSEDSRRPLSHYGIRQVQSSASLARAKGRYLETPVEILHSPKERAKQTAVLMAEILGWKSPLRELRSLESDADPMDFYNELLALDRSLFVVGHLPMLPHLAELLVPGGDFSFGEATLRSFEKDRKGWKQEWFVEPRPPDPRKGE